jgi:hypothetical protein
MWTRPVATVEVAGYEGYFVDTDGNVYSEWGSGSRGRRGVRKLLKPGLNDKGYLCVVLCDDGRRRTVSVHRLVALHFLFCRMPEINHKNGVKHDNRVANLEWCTSKENTAHAATVLGHDQARGHRRAVVGTNKQTGAVVRFESAAAGKAHGFMACQICKVCRGVKKSHAGYVWRYEDETDT